MSKTQHHALLRVAVMTVALLTTPHVMALGQRELQQLLDGQATTATRAAGDGFTEIDLSAYTEPFTTTLYVRAQNIRFVNGTLRRAASLEGPLVQITNGYTLELSAGATLSGNSLTIGYPIVEVGAGTLSVAEGGSIVDPFDPDAIAPVIMGTQSPDDKINSDRPVKLTEDASRLLMTGGTVEGEVTCNAENADLQILGGKVTWLGAYQLTTFSDIHLNPAVCSLVYANSEKKVYLTGAVADSLRIDYRNDQLSVGDCVIEGDGYTITQADVDKMSLYYAFWEYNIPHIDPPTQTEGSRRNVPYGYSYNYSRIPFKLVLRDNKVYLENPGPDLSNITSEEDLQKALDQIAAQKPTQPVEVTISPNGISLTGGVRVNADCKAIVTGGTISVAANADTNRFPGDALFYVQSDATLYLRDIVVDFRNCSLNGTAFFVYSGGSLAILSGVEYLNVAKDIIGSFPAFYYNGGSLDIASGKLPEISGRVLSNVGSAATYPQMVFLNGDLFENPRVYNVSWAQIVFNTAVSSVWTFEGNWADYTLEQPFITKHGGDLAASDYWQMRFDGLPSDALGRTAYYDGSRHSVQLKTYNSLQGLMDDTTDGDVDVPCDGVDVGEDFTVERGLQWLLDGGDCPDAVEEAPVIWMPGGCMFLQDPVLVKNVTFDSFSTGHRLYIRNSTTLGENVLVRNFLVFSIVEEGGRLVWTDARTQNVLYPIYNTGGTAEVRGGTLTGTLYNAGTLIVCGCVQLDEIQAHPQGSIQVTSAIGSTWTLDLTFDASLNYPDGWAIITGAEGYQLTDEDFNHLQLKLPEGCLATLDKGCNAVVLVSASGIQDVQAPRASSSIRYSLDGIKQGSLPPTKGIYIMDGRKVMVK